VRARSSTATDTHTRRSRSLQRLAAHTSRPAHAAEVAPRRHGVSSTVQPLSRFGYCLRVLVERHLRRGLGVRHRDSRFQTADQAKVVLELLSGGRLETEREKGVR
jgi:hypothetical protein